MIGLSWGGMRRPREGERKEGIRDAHDVINWYATVWSKKLVLDSELSLTNYKLGLTSCSHDVNKQPDR